MASGIEIVAIVTAIVSLVAFFIFITSSIQNFTKEKTKQTELDKLFKSSKERAIKNNSVKRFIEIQYEISKLQDQLVKLKTKALKQTFKVEQNRIIELMKDETDPDLLKAYSEVLSNLKTSKPETWIMKNGAVLISSVLAAIVSVSVTLISIYLSS